MSLPHTLYDAGAIRALDRAAIDACGIPGLVLMQRAGQAAFDALRNCWPAARRIAVVCGPGNNGGDGYVVALNAHRAGCPVTAIQIGDTGRLSADARACLEALRAARIVPVADLAALAAAELIVDGLLGVGLNKEVDGDFARAIAAINSAGAPVLSLDIPSGIDANTGRRLGSAVRATLTVTFIGIKQGLLTGDALDHVGTLEFADLDVPAAAYARVAPTAERLSLAAVGDLLAPRGRVAHKGDFGHVLVVGGAPGYSGAARLAAEAALRVGAGLVSVAAHPSVAGLLTNGRPEIMAHPVGSVGDLKALLQRASVVAVGPGLGQSAWAVELFACLRTVRQPLVVDADGLNLLAAEPETRANWVLTPHPGEAARLLGLRSTLEVTSDRYAAARALQARYGGVVCLKGAGSIVQDAGLPAVVNAGNPGMATGGMGDVLTGVIAGLLAQGLTTAQAARLGTILHATAGDYAARDGERGLLASDLMPHLRALVN